MNPYLTKKLAPILDRVPYVRRLRKLARDAGNYPPGHYYSPIPNQAEIRARLELMKRTKPELPDIRFNDREQFGVLERFAQFYGDLPFPEHKSGKCRYYYDQTVFSYPDAIFLFCFLRHIAPRKIIEVGSGLSSAVILDTVDRFFSPVPELTFIEPDPVRLNQILRPDDRSRINVLVERIQNAPVDLFTSLRPGDFLFVDSSHVLKCGSDVQFLFFEVLPRLPAGVYVHFHDIFRTFEYPDSWLTQGWYWNEAYFIRAFLSNNSAWEIYFFNNYVRAHFEEYLAEKMPLCLKDVGGSLYIRKTRSE